ncbi:MAG: FKBP-type peptidyl-prolyl cis-trans isomerase [Gammaproteobacteria bacterium]|nr:MAG: FKBP-type peptidyl-prolyl cis-trans isomerase [Gammaproteobacteria bacterium]
MDFKRATSALYACFFAMTLSAGALAEGETAVEADESTDAGNLEKQSYALGMQVGGQIKSAQGDIDVDAFLEGFQDTMAGKEPKISEAEATQLRMEFARAVQEKRLAERDQEGNRNAEEGAQFLAANAEKEGVQTTESGLQYVIMVEGTGPIPTAEDTVKVHYKGTLVSGVEFDSSYRRNQPATFGVTGVIPGWTAALQLMPVGSKWRLFIPPELAYGERGAGARIGPNSTLIFEVELIEIQKTAGE